MWGTNLYFFDIFLFVLYRKYIFIQFFKRNRCNAVMTCSKWEKGEKPTQDKQKEEVPNYAVTYILSNSSKVSSQTPDLILHWVVCVCGEMSEPLTFYHDPVLMLSFPSLALVSPLKNFNCWHSLTSHPVISLLCSLRLQKLGNHSNLPYE